MARESAHKPRPTSELASPQMSSSSGRSAFGQASLSSSSCETDDSDKTIRPKKSEQEQERRLSLTTSVHSSSYQSHTSSPLRRPISAIESRADKQDARLSSGQSSLDDMLLLLLESHNNQDISVFHQPKTEKQEKGFWQNVSKKKR